MMRIDCSDVRARVRAGEPLADEAVQTHIRGCDACREVVAGGTQLATVLDLEDGDDVGDLFSAMGAAIADERGRLADLRAQPTARRVAAVGGVGLVVALSVLVATPRPDLWVFPLPSMVAIVAVLALALAWPLGVVIRPLHRPARSGWWAAAVASLVPVVVAVLPPAHHAHPASVAGTGEDLWPRAIACFVFGAATSVPLIAAAWALSRDGLRRRGLWAAALAAAAALGNLALQLHCPLTAEIHRLIGHASVALAFGALALVIAAWQRTRPL